ncbi:MAG TPA: hypothetical protein VEJ84_20085, partial [Acidimicrobiales bacterium]|nr:hypothetical protein [Acidimicrobiales bacterium]
RAATASLQAEQGYTAWVDDLQATGCYCAPTNDVHYLGAQAAQAMAASAQGQLAAMWAHWH